MSDEMLTYEKLKDALSLKQGLLNDLIEKYHPADFIDPFRELEAEEKIELITELPVEFSALILREIQEKSTIEELFITESIPVEYLTSIIEHMPTDNAVDTLHTLSSKIAHRILSNLPTEKAQTLEEMMRYDDETAGGRMTDDFISLNWELTFSEAIKKIQKKDKKDVQEYKYIYLTDNNRCLVGTLPLVSLLLLNGEKKLKDYMEGDPFYVFAELDQEEVASQFTKYDLISLPVVNRGKKIIGRITVDDVINVINEEADEDIYKLVGTDDEEKRTQSSFKVAFIRLPWLLSTLCGSFICCTVIKLYQGQLLNYLGIIFFIPVITAMSGNIGVQCSTIIVRGLATGFVNLQGLGALFFKEFKISMVIGISCGILAGITSYILEHQVQLGVTVAISMLTSIIFASITGTAVPLILKKLNIDPAISSGPIITTFNDVCSLVIYFTLAYYILLR